MSYKRFFLLLVTLCVLLACAPIGLSQETQTSGQVIDPRGFDWQAATGNFVIQCAGNSQPYINGSPVSRNIPLVRLDGTGSFSQALWDTSFLTDVNNQPLSCQWQANFVDNCGVATFSVLFTGITGVSVNVTSQISAVSVDLSPACTPPGTLNSVTLGNLPPLFTVTEGGTAINPVFNFVPDQVGANLVLAGPTTGNGAYSFRQLVGGDLPLPTLSSLGGVDAYTSPTHQFVTAINADGSVSSAQPTTADISGSFVTAVNGTANQITSSGGNTPTLSLPSTLIAPGTIKSTGSLTAGNLTTGQCVQTSTGGLLTVTGSPCVNGSGFSQIQAKIFTGCTITAGTYNECVTSTQTWGTAFADSNYALTCTPFGTNADGGNKESYIIYQFTKTASNFSLTVQNNRGSTVVDAVEIDCTGVHP